jgi:endonuclease YncB( thermonuclease family)
MGVRQFLSFATPNDRRPSRPLGGVLPIIGFIFGLGLGIGAIMRPSSTPDHAIEHFADRQYSALGRRNAGAFNPERSYPAALLRVIDGDTFWARVQIWPGVEADTKVRLRSIDAPELRARCAREFVRAQAARVALQSILAAGGITVSHVGPDKYRGRIDADVAARGTADVSAAMLKGGWARSYDGGRRGSWCS